MLAFFKEIKVTHFFSRFDDNDNLIVYTKINSRYAIEEKTAERVSFNDYACCSVWGWGKR